MLQFPDCWDGKHLDSPNHKDHVAYGADQGCPADHPVRIPALTFDIQYGVKGTAAGYYLSSDPDGQERLLDARRRVPDVGRRPP